MGLLDPEYTNRRPPDWADPDFRAWPDREPANDPIHPWVGLLGRERDALNAFPMPEVPPDQDESDIQGFTHRLPSPWFDERAYHPTLQWEDSMPGLAQAEQMRQRRLALRDADTFRQPKTAAEVGIPEQEPSFQQKLDSMSIGEKLKMLLDDLLGRR